jgi:ribosomal protein S18 acetylase RimI-like enzyme
VTVIVRVPRLADVDELARINVETWRAAYAGILPAERLDMDLAEYRSRWADNVTTGRPGVGFLLVEHDGLVAGYAVFGGYRVQQDADPNEDLTALGELYAIYVDPPRQGRGLGRALHDVAMAALAVDHDRAAVWVLAENTSALRWYEGRGWSRDGATSLFEAAGQPLPEVRLRRPLRGD